MNLRHKGHGKPRGGSQFTHDVIMCVDRQVRQKEWEHGKLTGCLYCSKQIEHSITSVVKQLSSSLAVAMMVVFLYEEFKTKVLNKHSELLGCLAHSTICMERSG
uniref:Uncharacterized protein n=1 Tax=Magallana gigas TaxID=29159 RepID=K1PWE5_MAGGI